MIQAVIDRCLKRPEWWRMYFCTTLDLLRTYVSEIDIRVAISCNAIVQKSGTKLLRDTRQLASSVPITNRCRPCISTRSTDRKIPSHDFHKASEYDVSFAEYVQRSRKRSRTACAFRSFNTVLMIYVSEYILHRILSRINIDTGSEAFHVLSARHGRYFYFA